jgi:hypothetical protein
MVPVNGMSPGMLLDSHNRLAIIEPFSAEFWIPAE